MRSREEEATGYSDQELDAWAKQARKWARRGDVYAYFISGAKVKNPAAALAFMEKLGGK